MIHFIYNSRFSEYLIERKGQETTFKSATLYRYLFANVVQGPDPAKGSGFSYDSWLEGQ